MLPKSIPFCGGGDGAMCDMTHTQKDHKRQFHNALHESVSNLVVEHNQKPSNNFSPQNTPGELLSHINNRPDKLLCPRGLKSPTNVLCTVRFPNIVLHVVTVFVLHKDFFVQQ